MNILFQVQRAFRRHFDIPPRDHVPDRKCVLRTTENVSKERKGPLKTVRTPGTVERVRVSIQTGLCDNDPIILLTRSPRKGSRQRVATR
ncbi:hypothetical protein TNCV_3533061 [Trichonephila clavipes]|nr:hypothetical protein TNCV_3533061 [Trichonephila clavipes]